MCFKYILQNLVTKLLKLPMNKLSNFSFHSQLKSMRKPCKPHGTNQFLRQCFNCLCLSMFKKNYIGVVLEYQSLWQALLLPIKVANIIAQSTNNNPNLLQTKLKFFYKMAMIYKTKFHDKNTLFEKRMFCNQLYNLIFEL